MKKLFIVITLSIFIFSNGTNAQPRESKEMSGHAFLWSDAMKTGFKNEATEKRDRYTKHFELGNGLYKMYSSPGSIHYQGESGWEEINLRINKNNTGVHPTHLYYNGDNSFKTWYPQNPMSEYVYTKVKEGEMSERIEGMYVTDQRGQTVYTYKSGNPQVVVDQNTVSYTNLFPNVVVRYAQQVDGRKFDVELLSSQVFIDLPVNAQYLVIKEKVIIPANWTVMETEGYINLFAGKTWVANFLKPMAFETQNPEKDYHSDEDLMSEGSVRMARDGRELILYTTFSVGWLRDAHRQFPVILDPTVNYYPPSPTFPLTPTTSFATGRLISPTAAKSPGLLRLAANGTFSWAKFDLSSLSAVNVVSAARYYGYQYSPIGAAASKFVSVVGMQQVDPEIAANSAVAPDISTQINTTGPVYSNSYVFGSSNPTVAPFNWRAANLSASAAADITAQRASQGWTALGFKYASGNTGTMLQNGIEIFSTAPANLPYLALDYYTPAACSGTPIAGASMASVVMACGNPFTLDLSGNIIAINNSYQWQSSPAGLNTWTNLGTAQSTPVYQTTQSIPTDYQCVVTCTGSGISDTSIVISIGQNIVASCYCIPLGQATSATYITGVSTSNAFTNIINTGTSYSSSPIPGYGNYLALSASCSPSTMVNFSVTFAGGNQMVGVWIDWNQDGDFNDINENVSNTGSTLMPSPYIGSFTVPAWAVSGSTRMRVRTQSTGILTACTSGNETEDYSFEVLASCTNVVAATIPVSAISVCIGNSFTINASAAFSQIFQWKQSANAGGPYANVTGGAGANSLSYNTVSATAGVSYYVLETTCSSCSPCASLSNEVTVVIHSNTTGTFNATACNSYSWHNTTYSISGSYTYTTINVFGCDSVETLHLTVHYTNHIVMPVSACNSYLWKGTTYTNSGIYSVTYVNISGCDSIETLNLTIHQSTVQTFPLIVCDFYLLDGNTYTNSGSYSASLVNRYGCDSTVHINLLVNHSTSVSLVQSACDSYVFEGTTYTVSGVYAHTFTNVSGCDSIRTLNLTIGNNNVMMNQRAYIANFGSGNVSVIDLSNNTVIATLPVGSQPFGVAIHPTGSKVYISNLGSNTISVINTYTNMVIATITGMNAPNQILMHPNGNKLYVINTSINSVRVINTLTNTVQATIPVGNSPQGLCLSPDASKLYVSNLNSNNISVINTATNTVSYNINSVPSPLNLTISKDGLKLLVVSFSASDIKVVSTVSNNVIATIPATGTIPAGMQVTKDGTKLYVMNQGSLANLGVINIASNSLLSSLNTGLTNPYGISFNEDCSLLYIANRPTNEVKIFNISSSTIVGSIAVGTDPRSIGKFIGNMGFVSVTNCGPYLWDAVTYSSSGIYVRTFTNVSGCDSVATLNLTVNNPDSVSSSVFACNSYVWNGTTYTTNGVYQGTFVNTKGCDSVHTLALFISSANNAGASATTACNSYVFGDTTYTVSGIYTNVFTNNAGCDSVHTIGLTIHHNNTGASNQSSCNSYTWNGLTYSVSGTYLHTYTNVSGCDSVHSLHLTLSYSSSGSSSVTSCNSYIWYGNIYTVSGSYSRTYLNASGCNSMDVLNLTIRNSSSGSSMYNVCDSYLFGGTTYTVSGTYIRTFVNAVGCDSVHTLNLTVRHSNSGSSTVYACSSYQWHVYTLTQSGTYTHTFHNVASCDSVHTLHLIVQANSTNINPKAYIPVSPNGIAVVDLNSKVITNNIVVGNIPTAIAISPDKSRVYVANSSSGTVSIIDAATNTVINSISVANPKHIVVHPNGSKIYVLSLSDKAVVINTVTLQIEAIIQIGGLSSFATCLAISPDGSKLYASSFLGGLVDVINTNTNTISYVITPLFGPHRIALSPDGSKLYINSNNSIVVKNTTTFVTIATIPSVGYYGELCVSPDGSKLYYIDEHFIGVVNTISNSIETMIPVSQTLNPIDLSVSPDGMRIYVVYDTPGPISIINTQTQVVADSIPFSFTSNVRGNFIGLAGANIQVACDSFIWNGNTYGMSGVVTQTGTNIYGCDSVSTLNLTIRQRSNVIDTIEACNAYMLQGVTYTANTSISDTSANILGCDSIHTYQIVIYPANSGASSVTSCNAYIWNGNTYTNSGNYSATFTNVQGCDSVHTLHLTINCPAVLNLKFFLEGYYEGAGSMAPVLYSQGEGINQSLTDSVTVELHDVLSHSIAASCKALLHTDGTTTCVFPQMNGTYYVVVRHRNTLQTWSANPVVIGTSAAWYDFTTSDTMAYGLNQIEVESGVWAFYTGDIDQDENIDLFDVNLEETAATSFNFGYFSEDLNGDSNVDLLDVFILENNVNHFVSSMHP